MTHWWRRVIWPCLHVLGLLAPLFCLLVGPALYRSMRRLPCQSCGDWWFWVKIWCFGDCIWRVGKPLQMKIIWSKKNRPHILDVELNMEKIKIWQWISCHLVGFEKWVRKVELESPLRMFLPHSPPFWGCLLDVLYIIWILYYLTLSKPVFDYEKWWYFFGEVVNIILLLVECKIKN